MNCTIPNEDYFNWNNDIPGWPLTHSNKWLEWYNEWQTSPHSQLNETDKILLELFASGKSEDEICQAMRMSEERFNESCQWLFDSASIFTELKNGKPRRIQSTATIDKSELREKYVEEGWKQVVS